MAHGDDSNRMQREFEALKAAPSEAGQGDAQVFNPQDNRWYGPKAAQPKPEPSRAYANKLVPTGYPAPRTEQPKPEPSDVPEISDDALLVWMRTYIKNEGSLMVEHAVNALERLDRELNIMQMQDANAREIIEDLKAALVKAQAAVPKMQPPEGFVPSDLDADGNYDGAPAAPPTPSDGLRYPLGYSFRIDHDGFHGVVIGHYTRLDGKRGIVGQQYGTNIVHVYGVKWLPALAEQEAKG